MSEGPKEGRRAGKESAEKRRRDGAFLPFPAAQVRPGAPLPPRGRGPTPSSPPIPPQRLTSRCFEENKVIYCQSIQHTWINYKV